MVQSTGAASITCHRPSTGNRRRVADARPGRASDRRRHRCAPRKTSRPTSRSRPCRCSAAQRYASRPHREHELVRMPELRAQARDLSHGGAESAAKRPRRSVPRRDPTREESARTPTAGHCRHLGGPSPRGRGRLSRSPPRSPRGRRSSRSGSCLSSTCTRPTRTQTRTRFRPTSTSTAPPGDGDRVEDGSRKHHTGEQLRWPALARSAAASGHAGAVCRAQLAESR